MYKDNGISVVDTKIWGMVAVIQLTICLAYGVYQVVVLLEAVSGKLENPLQHEAGRWGAHVIRKQDKNLGGRWGVNWKF